MKAIQIKKHGNADVLEVNNIDKPMLKPNTVEINIKAASINHLDIWVRNGLPGLPIQLPLILGSDGAGVITQVHNGVSNYKVGDKVVIQPGTYDLNANAVINGRENYSKSYGILGETENGVQSEFVVLEDHNISEMPKHLTFEEAASMQLVFMTSYQMLRTRANISKSDIVLIYGATSGIGSAAIQIAKDVGSKVISTVGNKRKIQYAEDMGSDYVLIHNQDKFIKSIMDQSIDHLP